jgi:hypothetical protein
VPATIAACVATGLALCFIAWTLMTPTPNTAGPPDEAFYTTDDGKTLFADDAAKVAPFDHDGRQAVRAYVFTCDGGTTGFVQYLEKYSDEVKRQLEPQSGRPGWRPPTSMALVKRPGPGQWVPGMSQEASRLTLPSCPGGKGPPRQVTP